MLSDRIDDEIFEQTMKTFPELADPPYEKLINLDEEWMKSPEGKQRWRDFIERFFFSLLVSPPILPSDMDTLFCFFSSYKDKVKDYNFGSLIRTDAKSEYGETNTIFGEL